MIICRSLKDKILYEGYSVKLSFKFYFLRCGHSLCNWLRPSWTNPWEPFHFWKSKTSKEKKRGGSGRGQTKTTATKTNYFFLKQYSYIKWSVDFSEWWFLVKIDNLSLSSFWSSNLTLVPFVFWNILKMVSSQHHFYAKTLLCCFLLQQGMGLPGKVVHLLIMRRWTEEISMKERIWLSLR